MGFPALATAGVGDFFTQRALVDEAMTACRLSGTYEKKHSDFLRSDIWWAV